MVTPVVTVFEPGNVIGAIDPRLLRRYFDVDIDTLVLTYKDANNVVREARFVGLLQPREFDRRVALRADANFTAADFLAGSLGTFDKFTIPDDHGMFHVGYWQGADELELTVARTAGDPASNSAYSPAQNEINIRHLFGEAQPLEVDGTAGYFWATEHRITSVYFGIPWVFRSDGASFPPFPRRVAAKLPGDPGDPDVAQVWTAADFTGVDSSLSYSSHIADVTRVSGSPDHRYHKAYWVPDEWPDISDVLQSDESGELPGLGGGTGFAFLYERQAGTVTVDGVAGKVWGTNRVLNPFDPATLAYAYLLIVQLPEA